MTAQHLGWPYEQISLVCHENCLCNRITDPDLWQRGATEPLTPTAPLWRPKVVAS